MYSSWIQLKNILILQLLVLSTLTAKDKDYILHVLKMAASQQQSPGCNPILKVILEGLYDDECILSTLRGCPNIIKDIWNEINQFYMKQIVLPAESYSNRQKYMCDMSNMKDFVKDDFISERFLSGIYLYDQWWSDSPSDYSFLPPSDININMMPFIVGVTLKKCKLPGTVLV